MTKQQGNRRNSVALGFGLFAVAIAIFGAAFYLFDGMSLVDSILGNESPVEAETPSQDGDSAPAVAEPEEPQLTLPAGMSDEFALRVWQEQVDSQLNIERLVSGAISSIEITSSVVEGDEARLGIVASLDGGPDVDGEIGMSRFGGKWYTSYVAGLRGDTAVELSEIPDIEDVDIDVLNTIISEQAASSEVLEAYVLGEIDRVDVTEIVEGPDTVTLELRIFSKGAEASGQIVLISRDIEGKDHWFIAKFTKMQNDS